MIFENIKEKIDFSEVECNFNKKIADLFSLDFYNQCFLQEGIDFYNTIIGGKTLENGEKQKGVNECINEYSQRTKEKVPDFKTLDKQILGEKEKFIDEIKDDENLSEVLKEFQKTAESKTSLIKKLFTDFIENNKSYNLSQIYISKKSFNTIAREWTGETDIFEEAFFDIINVKEAREEYDLLRKEKNDPKIKKDKDGYKFPNFIKLQHIKEALEKNSNGKFWKERYYKNPEDAESKGFLVGTEPIWNQFLQIFHFEFSSLFEREITTETGERKVIGYNAFKEEFDSLLQNFKNDQNAKVTVKNFADVVLRIHEMAKYFAIEKKRGWLAKYEIGEFYTNPQNGYLLFYKNAYEEIVQPYNKIRNYLTKKPYSEEKWKLNFENPTLADGWDKNKESDNSAVILRKNGKYFLGLMTKGHNKIFDDQHQERFVNGLSEGKYEKVVYKFFPEPSKMIPKCSTQLSQVKQHFLDNDSEFTAFCGHSLKKDSSIIRPLVISKSIFDLNNFEYKKSYLAALNGRSLQENERVKADSKKPSQFKLFQKEFYELSKNYSVYRNALNEWINFCKNFLISYESTIELSDFSYLKDVIEYKSIDEFYSDVEEECYKISFQDISEKYINEKNENGELYLFEIHNKDWNLDKARDGKLKTTQKNLHTLYFESLFSTENIAKNFKMKLNGQAEIFYRPETKVKKLGMKKDKQNNDVVNHKRYSEDKIFFYAPITFNRSQDNSFRFNSQVNNLLAQNPNINIIGIDRGEKHLVYYSVITQDGEVLESGSLNVINGVNYAEKLEGKAKNREQARKDWQDVEGIKNLKKGYISQVVRTLADLSIEHNAIIVMEDLNMRFKQIRGGIEKSVYQQLERALIEKLNYLAEKGEKDPEKAGHLLKAYQLTAPFTTFKEMGKQTGIIFYTQAAYTSSIDPETGWRPHLYLKYSKAEQAKDDINKFNSIELQSGHFEFTYDIEVFKKDKKEYPKNTVWTVCSSVERFRWNKKLNNNKGDYDHYPIEGENSITSKIKSLFEGAGINISGNIKVQIQSLEAKGNEKFFKDFIFFFNLICQIRNTDKKVKNKDYQDFILSPVAPFFDSRKDNAVVKNGDANGAYNIARKGIIILQKISNFAKEKGSCDTLKWEDLYVSNKEWDDFAQNFKAKSAKIKV